MTATICPVLAFTPEVMSALRWFDRTHELVIRDGRASYTRVALPRQGGVGDQSAWLLEALELLRGVHNDLVQHMTRPATTDLKHG